VERWARELERRLPALRRRATPSRGRPPRSCTAPATSGSRPCCRPGPRGRARAGSCARPILAPLAWPRTAVVLHDAAPLREPGWYSSAYVAFQRAVLPRIARRARLVITVSEFSRRELAQLLQLDPGDCRRPGGVDAPASARGRIPGPRAPPSASSARTS
jgi:hypothetical protein